MSKPDIGILTIDIETSPIEAFAGGSGIKISG